MKSIVTFAAAVLFITSSFARSNNWVKLNDPTKLTCAPTIMFLIGQSGVVIRYNGQQIFGQAGGTYLLDKCRAIQLMAEELNGPLYFKVDNNNVELNITEILQV